MWPYTVWVFFIGFVLFSIAIIYRLWSAIKRFRLRSGLYNAYHDLVCAIGYCYGAGLFLKFSGFGPDWLRWWLGDFGFPVALALIFMSRVEAKYTKNETSLSYAEWIIDRIMYIKTALRMLVVTYLLSVGYEVMCGVINMIGERNGVTLTDFGIGGFDPVDVLMYSLGAGLAAFIWLKSLKLLQRERVYVTEREAQLEKQKREQRAKAGTGARKYAKKRR